MRAKHPKKKSLFIKSKKMIVATKKAPYEKDFHLWTETQVNFLKKGEFENLDIDHLIEEIESLGRSERDKLERFLTLLLMHMLKVKYQPERHTKSWDLSIKNSRHQAKKVLKENPSLKPKLQQSLKDAYFSARLEAAIETGLEERAFPKECPWKIDEIL